MQGDRLQRIGELMQRELAELLREVKDPRVPSLVTIGAVEVNRDLSLARVYLSVLGEPEREIEACEGLQHAAGFLRSHLARRLRLRRMPALRFVADPTARTEQRLQGLLAGDSGITRQ